MKSLRQIGWIPICQITRKKFGQIIRKVTSTSEFSYDVFLSYNSADHGVVENVARKLRDEGLEPFLDRWYLAPGARWRSKLEETLSSCKAVAIFVGPGEMGSWQQREVDVALDLQSRSPNLPVIPVLLPGCEPPLGFLRQLTWVDLRTQTLDAGNSNFGQSRPRGSTRTRPPKTLRCCPRLYLPVSRASALSGGRRSIFLWPRSRH